MRWRLRQAAHQTVHVDNWITREFSKRGLTPPHCTPEALARALEREHQIIIVFRPHVSDDPGVYGMLYRSEDDEHTYIVLFRANHSIVLRRLTLFHELAHLIFDQELPDVSNSCNFRRSMVLDAKEARAEAFAVGAMHCSFYTTTPLQQPKREKDVAASAFGKYLKRIAYW